MDTLRPVACALFLLSYLVLPAAPAETVSWSIGRADSVIDGGASAGPVVFSWTFDRPVEHGLYADGTPWVVWEPGLKLVAVSPAATRADLPDAEDGILRDAVTDATCINPGENELPLDRRMGGADGSGPWNHGENVWDGEPFELRPGDTIVTGRGRRDDRGRHRRMVFTAVGVCNVVAEPQEGRYRPPIRMPRELRAGLVMPREVDVRSLPGFNLPGPRDWAGRPVTLDLSGAVEASPAEDLLNGPVTHCGIYAHVWYETVGGMLNHNLSGTDDVGYHRNVADRFAKCLHTAFDPSEDPAVRQRSLNKFIQGGLDFFFMHCLGYSVWNGGGGHPNGLEGIITLTGALLADARITEAMKYQRFPGSAVGRDGVVVDMLQGSYGDFSRTEGCYLVEAAGWQSGDFVQRKVGNGAATLEEAVFRIDFARPDMVLNNEKVPFTGVADAGDFSAILVASDFAWPMFTRNKATEARRSYRYLPGAVLRIDGDATIRRVVKFLQSPDSSWSEGSWQAAGGTGGAILVYPALTAAEKRRLASGGHLTTGVASQAEADSMILWESWPVDGETRVLQSFFVSPDQDYLGIKLADNFHWLPFYHLLEDPGAAGKRLYEESPSYRQIRKFVRMQRDLGTEFWERFTADSNVPSSPTVQALVRHYLLDDQMASVLVKVPEAGDSMWNE